MYVILYLPEGAEPEIFGPFSTYQIALNMLRSLAIAAGGSLDAPPSGLMASVDILIAGEKHRYQLIKLASTSQLEVHSAVIQEMSETVEIEVVHPEDLSPPGRFSSY